MEARASGPQFLGQKNRPRIPTQFKYLRSLIFIIAPFKNTQIYKPLLACQNALKLTYSNVEFLFFSGEDPGTPAFRGWTPDPPGEGRGVEDK